MFLVDFFSSGRFIQKPWYHAYFFGVLPKAMAPLTFGAQQNLPGSHPHLDNATRVGCEVQWVSRNGQPVGERERFLADQPGNFYLQKASLRVGMGKWGTIPIFLHQIKVLFCKYRFLEMFSPLLLSQFTLNRKDIFPRKNDPSLNYIFILTNQPPSCWAGSHLWGVPFPSGEVSRPVEWRPAIGQSMGMVHPCGAMALPATLRAVSESSVGTELKWPFCDRCDRCGAFCFFLQFFFLW